MTRDDIIRMAQEAHLDVYGLGTDHEKFVSVVERFANLVAAAEREKVAHWMMTACYATGHGDTTEDLLRELAWQADERIVKAAAAEREACAVMINILQKSGVGGQHLIDAIRERGAP